MKLEVRIGDRTRAVDIRHEGTRWLATVDGRPLAADVVELGPGVYSILVEGQSFEVRVQPGDGGLHICAGGREFSVQVVDPRQWRGRRGGVFEIAGRQQVTAPMPGKVVRVLVKTGEHVLANQELVVVEAMKMQNAVRSPKGGKVERLAVVEGQAVNAGDVLVVVA